MDEGMDLWYEALKLGVQFSRTTKCATLEIFRSGSRAEPYWIESSVDDVTLARWLDTVSTSLQKVFINLIVFTGSHYPMC
jgi:hypothetical protein